MEQSKIDFKNITNLNYSNRNHMHDDCYTNDNILLYVDDDIELDKNEIKRNNKKQFEEILNQTKLKNKSLSEKLEMIINNKSFSLKNFLVNYLNIQSIPIEEKIKISNNYNLINNNNANNNLDIKNNIDITNNINLNNNHFNIIEPLNIKTSQNNIFTQNSGEINPNLIGKKRALQNNNIINNEKKKQEKNMIFNDILIICKEISNFNNHIIKKEEQNNINNDNDNIETTLIINDNPIATIYLNKDVVRKIYVFKNKKNLIKENEILSQLKQIKKNMTVILNKLKKN